jgi:hypothetical protein
VVREPAYTLGLLSRPRRHRTAKEPAHRAGEDPGAPAEEVAALGALLGIRRTAGTPLEPRPQVAVVDELDGSLLALTDAAGLRRGTLGPAAVCNLCALCEHHRRLEHQAPGWALTATGDGGLTWTTPGGIRITTHPPRFGADDDVLDPGRPPGADARRGGAQPPDRPAAPG